MRAQIMTFGISIFLNLAMMVSLDHTVSVEGFRSQVELQRVASMARQKNSIQFEFVEAPPKTSAQSPKRQTKKISNRDALNQDLLKDKSKVSELPSVKTRGPADQLRQMQGAGVPPSPASAPQEAQSQKRAPGENRQNQTSNRENQTSEKVAEPQKVEKALKGETPPKGEDTDIFKNRPKAASQNQEASAAAKAPSPARNATMGSPGGDKINTQEMSRASSRGAQLYGVTSFEATGSGMGVYMKNLKEKIWLSWFPYLVSRYPQDFKTADAVLSITLNEKGDVKIVKLIESEGSPLFASYCIEAVQRASNFGALPKDILALIGKDTLELKFGFHYK